MSNIDRIESELENLISAMDFAGVTPDDAIRELKLRYAAELEAVADRVRKSV